MRYRLRTLMILLAAGPPVLGWLIWPEVETRWRAWQSSKQRTAFTAVGPGLQLIYYRELPPPEIGGLIELPVDE